MFQASAWTLSGLRLSSRPRLLAFFHWYLLTAACSQEMANVLSPSLAATCRWFERVQKHTGGRAKSAYQCQLCASQKFEVLSHSKKMLISPVLIPYHGLPIPWIARRRSQSLKLVLKTLKNYGHCHLLMFRVCIDETGPFKSCEQVHRCLEGSR